jgi:hypothetical protein
MTSAQPYEKRSVFIKKRMQLDAHSYRHFAYRTYSTAASGRMRPVVTVCEFSGWATCYAGPNGRVRPEAVTRLHLLNSLVACEAAWPLHSCRCICSRWIRVC